MRLIAIIPLLLMSASVVLTVLCIMAGYQSTFMENYELITFNTSLLGQGIVNAATGGILSQLPIPLGASAALATKAINVPDSVSSLIPASLQSAVSQIDSGALLESIARRLKIHDFYKLHMLDFCEGYYEPGPIANSTFSSPSQNITSCSPAQAFYYFNATQVLKDELLPGVTLDQIQFPQQVQTAIDAMAITQKVMFVLYCVGAVLAGIAAIEAIIAFLTDGRASAACGILLDCLAFLTIGIASGCATAFMIVVSNAVNQYGAQVNLQAYKGVNFLIITWIATLLPLVAAVLWCVDCCAGPGRRNRNSRSKD